MPNQLRAASSVKRKIKSDVRLSKAGYEFDVFSDKWQLNKSTSINLRLLESFNLAPKFELNFRLILAAYSCEFSSSYVVNIYLTCRHIFSTGVTNRICEEHILNYRATLTEKTECRLGSARAFFMDWHDRELGGIEKKVIALLEKMRLKGSEKGKAVTTGCPYSGAYTYEEQIAFIDWYVNAYTKRAISLKEYAFIIALQYTGARPIQLCYLYYGDLVYRLESDIKHFDLKIPNVKKRNERIRDSFQRKSDMNKDLMLVLEAQAKDSIKTIEKHFGVLLSNEEKKLVPIFLNASELDGVSDFRNFIQIENQTPDYFCMTVSGYKNMMARIARLCPLKTNRIMIDGQPGDLHINARRFRYTHATNMAIAGAGDIVIATELGHEDTQYVKIYTEFKEEIAERIDDALAPSLVPLAQAFAGTLIDSEKDAIRANDPRSRINNSEGYIVGNCGNFGFCANGMIHCYTCIKFQPWVNAPHKGVLDNVLAERDRKREMGASEFVLQSHNRSIAAIKVVIQMCEERKQEFKNKGVLDV